MGPGDASLQHGELGPPQAGIAMGSYSSSRALGDQNDPLLRAERSRSQWPYSLVWPQRHGGWMATCWFSKHLNSEAWWRLALVAPRWARDRGHTILLKQEA